jgi:putative glycosyl hydrolase
VSNSGSGGATSGTTCKRGIAANTAPGAAFFPAIGWWYDWSMKSSGTNVGIEFVPMMWGKSNVNTAIPSGSKYLLTFNEPNFHSQSNLTPQQAASYWPAIEKAASAAQVSIVSPAMNFCGPADQCNGTSPYQYLKDFFAACASCKVDYVAVHWYNCDLPSLLDYLEPGGSLEGFEQFGKPIWLTEFSCNGSASTADQEKFMRAAIPYLEGNTHVYRYSWFSAGPIPNAQLLNTDGSPTALGKLYIGLEGTCR